MRPLTSILLFSLLLSMSCKDNDITPTPAKDNPCNSDSGYSVTYSQLAYSSPTTSTTYPDILVYLRHTADESLSVTESELVVYNITSETHEVIYTSQNISEADLSSKGHIAFVDFDRKLYAIHLSGDSLRQLSDKTVVSIDWHPDGERLLGRDLNYEVREVDTRTTPPQLYKILGVSASFDINWVTDSSIWFYGAINGNYLALTDTIFLYQYNSQTATSIAALNGLGHHSGIKHPTKNEFYWTGFPLNAQAGDYKQFLLRTNLSDFTTDTLISYCDAGQNGDPTITSDGSHLIYRNNKGQVLNTDTVEITSFLYKLNLNTMEEERLEVY